MSFKGFDRQTYIVDSAKAFGSRKISKREFMRRMGMAGIGFSAFSAGLLGNTRRRGGLVGAPANAADITLPDDQVKFLKEVGGKYKGATVRYTSEATPPTVVLNQIKDQFTNLTGINVEVEIVPLEQVLAKATQDVQGQLGTYDLYYLDQAWVATFAPDCVDPIQYTKDKPDLAMPGFDWEDFSKPLVNGLAMYDGKMVGIPFDIPIFILMYRQDILEKHGIKVPTNYGEFTAAVHAITEAEKANNIFGTGLQAKSGHYSLECDWTQAVWGHGGSVRDPYATMELYHSKWFKPTGTAATNFYRWKNADFDAAVDKMSLVAGSDPQMTALFLQAIEIWLKELPDIPLLQFYHRIPMNQTYWTNWPDENNPYINGAFWHRTVLLEVLGIKPAS